MPGFQWPLNTEVLPRVSAKASNFWVERPQTALPQPPHSGLSKTEKGSSQTLVEDCKVIAVFIPFSFHLYFLGPSIFKPQRDTGKLVPNALLWSHLPREFWMHCGQEMDRPRTPSCGSCWRFGCGSPTLTGKPSPGNSLPSLRCLLCQLMAVIITSKSSFVIANQRGGRLFGEMKKFTKQIAV